ncbi:hypothetical protein B0T16DRAFT_191950 [Cercophora newfieldiana]|uniref:Uncharacterized protein n=1 Tax=Cercophora newfieldiana TaxID=92897 RepID=A0AA39Y1G7_9PEZI|nr:hypothetical protein B0T16DRAFT_191950 [Cercophora newfieldiana]
MDRAASELVVPSVPGKYGGNWQIKEPKKNFHWVPSSPGKSFSILSFSYAAGFCGAGYQGTPALPDLRSGLRFIVRPMSCRPRRTHTGTRICGFASQLSLPSTDDCCKPSNREKSSFFLAFQSRTRPVPVIGSPTEGLSSVHPKSRGKIRLARSGRKETNQRRVSSVNSKLFTMTPEIDRPRRDAVPTTAGRRPRASSAWNPFAPSRPPSRMTWEINQEFVRPHRREHECNCLDSRRTGLRASDSKRGTPTRPERPYRDKHRR